MPSAHKVPLTMIVTRTSLGFGRAGKAEFPHKRRDALFRRRIMSVAADARRLWS